MNSGRHVMMENREKGYRGMNIYIVIVRQSFVTVRQSFVTVRQSLRPPTTSR